MRCLCWEYVFRKIKPDKGREMLQIKNSFLQYDSNSLGIKYFHEKLLALNKKININLNKYQPEKKIKTRLFLKKNNHT